MQREVNINERDTRLRSVFHRKENVMNYYDEIKKELINNEINRQVKDYSKERNTVITYFEIGRLSG